MKIETRSTKFLLLVVGLSVVLYIDLSVIIIAAKFTSLPILLTFNPDPSNLIIITLLSSILYFLFSLFLSFFTDIRKTKL
ncbi:hypothetical protein [Caldiplasma sukawensis]